MQTSATTPESPPNRSATPRFSNCCMPPASVSPNWCRWISPTSTSPIAPSKSPAKATSNAWCRSDYPPSVRWRLGWNKGRPVLARTATDAVKSRAANALFLGARGGRIDQRIARDIVHRAAREAGVPDISPHALRHSARHAHAGRRRRSEGGAGDARAFLLENYTTLYARLHRAAQEPLTDRPFRGHDHYVDIG